MYFSLIMKCIWCLRDRELLPKKKFCNECNLNGRECIRCHRPMPPKFYLLHSHRCNSCHKKHEKEKLKRLFVDIYVLYLYNVNCFLLEWQLGEFETITVKNGKFGKFVELNQRPRLAHQKPRFFTFTPNTWKKFYVKALDLNTVEDRIQLAEKKMVTVSMYNGWLYRNFTTQLERGKAYLNLFSSVWKNLLKAIPEINRSLQDGTPCQTCASQMKFVKLFNGRLKDSVLTPEQQEAVDKYNATVNNQLGIQCDYCGLQREWGCHCHRVDCRECSPDCFCDTCGNCLYYMY